MKNSDFLTAVQSRAARIAVGASAARGRGNAGTVAAARDHLRTMDLRDFGRSPARFRSALDRETEALRKRFPRSAAHWGIARKLLNIFLRDCLYTTYLEAAYSLKRAESALEIPLDSVTALQLKRAAGRGKLPLWPGVKHLTPEISESFQSFALEMATQMGLARVHLDAFLWSRSRDD